SALIGDGHRIGEFARMRHRQVDRACTDTLGPGRHPAAEPYGRLRSSGDLDVAPGERARHAEADRLANGFLPREPACVALRRIRTRVAVRPFRFREAALAETRITLECTAHALDLDQVDADGQRWSSSQSGSCAIDEMIPSGLARFTSTASGLNFPVRTSTVFIPCT